MNMAKRKEGLVDGITQFWPQAMTVEKCKRYINHTQKVFPIVIKEREGRASGC